MTAPLTNGPADCVNQRQKLLLKNTQVDGEGDWKKCPTQARGSQLT